MKPGDRFRFAAEGVVVEKTPGVHGVTFDGHEHSRLNYLLDEFFAAHAELIPPPYVPQVGDIVMTPDGYGVVLDVTGPDAMGWNVVVSLGFTECSYAGVTLVARPGEVYQP